MIKLLLVVIFLITLWVPAFNRVEPTLFGFPFFYWYQIVAIVMSSGIIWIVYAVENRKAAGK